ncbi:MAG: hypothetical protein R2750_14205 [Bacteroidales bacterium]
MGINKNNYEVYFLDYYENRLQTEQTAELLVFLESHPELKEEFESFEMITLPDEPILFQLKDQLKKKVLKPTPNINSVNYEQYLVADLENDLSPDETDELKHFISINPEVKLELNLLKKTKLFPENITYEDKRSLKKGGLFLLYPSEIFYAVSIAALLLLFIGFYFGDDRGQSTSNRITQIGVNFKAPVISVENISIDLADIKSPSQRNKYKAESKTENIGEIAFHKNKEIQRIPGLRENIKIDFASTASELKIESPGNFELPVENSQITEANIETNKSFFGRFVSGFTSKLFDVERPEKKSFLEYTVSGYNMIADREVEVEKEYTSSGRVSAYNVKGETISFSRKVNPKSAE